MCVGHRYQLEAIMYNTYVDIHRTCDTYSCKRPSSHVVFARLSKPRARREEYSMCSNSSAHESSLFECAMCTDWRFIAHGDLFD